LTKIKKEFNKMGNKKQIQIDSDEFSSIVEKLHFLEESNSALVAIQNKLDRLNYFRSDLVLSYDIHHIVEKGLAKFQELVETKVCSVFLVDKRGFEFVRKISIPEELSSIVQKEVDAQIQSGTFGWIINSGMPACVPAEVFRGEGNSLLSIIIAPLSHKERTMGVVVIIFEEDQDFIKQQTLKLLYILAGFFSLAIQNAYPFNDLKRSYFDIIRAIANSVEARDPYTKGHSNRVGQIARAVAKELDWSDDEIKLIDWGGMLHDVGKIGINDAILNKPGKLNEEEYKAIKLHPSIGAKIVKGISFLEPVAPYILEHHERFDGKGYPQGLAGENISIKGRVLAVANVFDAVTTDRTYHKALDPEVAFKEIIAKNALSQFDPKIVDALERAWRSGKIE
ncbi:MAG: HD domain-containing protein, partial [Deltaproteobacteria bacterium]|nr:HD domain-containing protein [Deltaproteobacteria bacterium]